VWRGKARKTESESRALPEGNNAAPPPPGGGGGAGAKRC
jgi:hypothetical protein